MIYLDNNATTQPDRNMLNAASEEAFQIFGNPSSLHSSGRDARDSIENSRRKVAEALNANPSEIIFTSGGTEANSIALADVSKKYIKVISAVEHSSVYKADPTFIIPVNKDGLLNLNKLEYHLKSFRPCLVSIMSVNNETGVILDPAHELFELKKKYGFLLHVDAVQGFGKIPIDLKTMPIDMLSISAHKIHGLKGAGALYINKELEKYPEPLFVGGSHEFGYRPGTENHIGIFSLGYMADKITKDEFYAQRMKNIKGKRDFFETALSDISIINGHKEHRAENTTNLYFPDIKDLDLFLELLSEGGLLASGKSACTSGLSSPSRALSEMFGEGAPQLEGSVRFSLSVNTTDEQLDKAVIIIRDTIQECKKIEELTNE